MANLNGQSEDEGYDTFANAFHDDLRDLIDEIMEETNEDDGEDVSLDIAKVCLLEGLSTLYCVMNKKSGNTPTEEDLLALTKYITDSALHWIDDRMRKNKTSLN